MIVNRPKKKRKMSRYTVMSIITGSILGVMTLRLLYLQVFSYEDYKEKANTTSTRFVSDVAPRGQILDKNGIALATNKTTYSLTYTETKEVKKHFYETMTELFKILDESKESIPDSMLLKVADDNSMYFDFTTDTQSGQDYAELRFKKDRGLDSEIKNKLYPKADNLSDEQSAAIDKELLKITPEETFYKLVKIYNLIELIDPEYDSTAEKKNEYKDMTGEEMTQKILASGYSLQDLKKYMLVKDIIKIQNLQGNKTITIVSNISKETVLIVKQKLTDIPGVDVSSVPIRYYPYTESNKDDNYGNLASSVLGYVSSINSSEEANYTLRGYDASTDLIGKAGIESAFEDQLKGVKGGTTVKVNSSGRVTEKLFELQSYPGNNVQLTIDSGLQWASEQALKDTITDLQTTTDSTGYTFKNATRGALITVDVSNGNILSMVSYPGYNANLFTIPGTLSQEENEKYFNPDLTSLGKELIQKFGLNKTVDELFPNGEDPYDLYAKPFYNYATKSLIPPGSTFKPLTSIAGLQSKAITPTEKILDTGIYDTHKELFSNRASAPRCLIYTNSGGTHGYLDVAGALEVSCNVFFYEVGYRMYHQAIDNGESNEEALNAIAKYAWQFGLGVDPESSTKKEDASTGIEISENFGQCYNFKTFKDSSKYYAKFEIVKYLEAGDYKGTGLTFIPFDIGVNDDDNDEVKNSKKTIKDIIEKSLDKVGTNETTDQGEFTKSIKKEVQNIMKYSDIYKSRVSEYEKNTGKTVNLESQANNITDAISRFTLSDKPAEITTPAQIVYASIGQGNNTFTPVQLASYVSTIANGGTRYKLHLVDKITDSDGNTIEQYDKKVLNTVEISPENLAAVKNGMSKVNNDDGGTAAAKFAGFPSELKTAGKTGTADFREDQNQYGRAPYATYISFAPLDDPKIAVVAVVFDGGHGGLAAQAVRAVYEYYFRDEIKALHPGYTSESYNKYVVNNPFLKTKNEDSNAATDPANTNNKAADNSANAAKENNSNAQTNNAANNNENNNKTTSNENNTSKQKNKNNNSNAATKKKENSTIID